jgi:hypothetical protein
MSTVMILPPSPANPGRKKVDDYCAARSGITPPLPWPTFPPPFSAQRAADFLHQLQPAVQLEAAE